MRRFGLLLLVIGLGGFFYASSLSAPPVPEGTSVSQEIQSPAGRIELLRYASGGAALVGLLLSMFPKGR
jgi:hypothetical protein